MARWKKRAEKLCQGKQIATHYFKKTWKSLVLQNTQMKEAKSEKRNQKIRKKETLFTREVEKSIN